MNEAAIRTKYAKPINVLLLQDTVGPWSKLTMRALRSEFSAARSCAKSGDAVGVQHAMMMAAQSLARLIPLRPESLGQETIRAYVRLKQLTFALGAVWMREALSHIDKDGD